MDETQRVLSQVLDRIQQQEVALSALFGAIDGALVARGLIEPGSLKRTLLSVAETLDDASADAIRALAEGHGPPSLRVIEGGRPRSQGDTP